MRASCGCSRHSNRRRHEASTRRAKCYSFPRNP
jgi:hypothetical protein